MRGVLSQLWSYEDCVSCQQLPENGVPATRSIGRSRAPRLFGECFKAGQSQEICLAVFLVQPSSVIVITQGFPINYLRFIVGFVLFLAFCRFIENRKRNKEEIRENRT